MKKILVGTHDFISPIRGGGGLRTLKTALELKKKRYDVRIIAPSDKKNIGGIVVENIIHPQKNRWYIFASLLFFIVFLTKLIKNIRYDAIFVHNSVAGIPASFFSRLLGKRLIYDVTDIHSEYILANKHSSLFLNLLKKLEYASFKAADNVIVVSNAMRDVLVKNGVNKNKISVIYDGVEFSNFSAKKEKNKFITIIHHGGIDEQDGVEYIAEASPLILKKHPKTRFLIVGSGAHLKNVKKITINNRTNSNFIFTGWKPYAEMKNYLKKANIGLILRPCNLPNNTVLTLKLFEYRASRTCCVSSRLKAIEEVSKNNKDIIFFEPGNYKDLANKINYLIGNRNIISKIALNAREKARDFDWDKLISQIVSIIIK